MANLNKVLLIGRLTRDPESRSTPSGSTVVAFGLAVNRNWTRRDSGEKVEETAFIDVEAWGRTGETIARYMKKGRQIFIEGRLKFDTWERDGQRRSKLSVTAESFQFIDSQGGGDRGYDGGGGGTQRDRAPQGGSEGAPQGGGDAAPQGAGEGAPQRAPAGPPTDYPRDDDIPF